jgi:Zn-finger nucleic acid-binding protein
MRAETLSGLEVDRCGFCEGVFLDAGELEAIFTKRAEERRGFWRGLLRI